MEKCIFYKKKSKETKSKQKGTTKSFDASFYYCGHMCAHSEISDSRLITIGHKNNLTCEGDDKKCQCDFSSLYED